MAEEELRKITKRTAEVMDVFIKNYLECFAKDSLQSNVEDALADVVADMKDAFLPIVRSRRALPRDPPVESESEQVEQFVGVKIATRKPATAVDDTVYTAYRLVSCLISPGGSVIGTFDSRFRRLLNMDVKLRQTLGDLFPSDAVFPPKKYFGNMDEEFLKSRQKALDEYLALIVSNDEVALHEHVLQTLSLEDDPRAELDRAIFIDAFLNTCEEEKIAFNKDPSDFEDEPEALSVLMISVADAEVMPEIRKKIGEKMPIAMLQDKMTRKARAAVAKAIHGGVDSAWRKSEKQFSDAKDKAHEQLEQHREAITSMFRNILNKIAPPLVAKLAKKDMSPPEDEKKDPQIVPSLHMLDAGREVVQQLSSSAKTTSVIDTLLKDVKSKFALEKKLQKKAKLLSKGIIDPDMKHTFTALFALVDGVSHFWLSVLQLCLQGVRIFCVASDALEEKLTTESIEATNTKLKAEIRKVALQIATFYDDQSDELPSKVSVLSQSASSGFIRAVQRVPESLIDFLATFRTKYIAALRAAVSSGSTSKEAVRDVMVNTGVGVFDKFFASSWAVLSTSVTDAIRITLVEKLEAAAKPIMQEIEGDLVSFMPPELASAGMKIESITELALDKVLNSIAAGALQKIKYELEEYVFHPDDSSDDQ